MEFNIYDVKKNIEQKRQEEKSKATPKRIYDYNPNYLSDKKIFEWNFDDEPKNNTLIGKPNKELINTVNVFEEVKNPTEIDKYQKKIFKSEQHHKQ